MLGRVFTLLVSPVTWAGLTLAAGLYVFWKWNNAIQ